MLMARKNVAAPAAGPHDHENQNNITIEFSNRPVVYHAKLTRGSSGIYVLHSPDSHLSFIEGYDFRGPFPRGQLAQWDTSPNGVLEDFSVVMPQDTSWAEDNVNVYKSGNLLIRRGLIDGNNSPSGIGVIFERCFVFAEAKHVFIL